MKHNIHWFRRDLRLDNNHSLHNAIKEAREKDIKLKCIFIFDQNILQQLPKEDRRVQFIYNQLESIREELLKHGSDLWVYHGKPIEIWNKLSLDKNLVSVHTNRDYEPYATNRDKAIYAILKEKDILFKGYKDQVIFEKAEISTQKDTVYTVYTPYMKAWKRRLNSNQDQYLQDFSIELNGDMLLKKDGSTFFPTMESLGFSSVKIPDIPLKLDSIDIGNYGETRDIPSLDSTTRIGTALRFGTVSVREAVQYAHEFNEVYLSELIWREFFTQILYNFPRGVTQPFRKKYANIAWRNNDEEFNKWCQGKTGFPIVDAGMRELNATGFMHNRVRMITASFLVKDLLIDWRWGEAYFAKLLMDYDLSANNGNWQWAAGTGTDAAPYFRIFNPESQQKKFDPDLIYIKKWVPEYGTNQYPDKMVNHKEARERCLKTYKTAIEAFDREN